MNWIIITITRGPYSTINIPFIKMSTKDELLPNNPFCSNSWNNSGHSGFYPLYLCQEEVCPRDAERQNKNVKVNQDGYKKRILNHWSTSCGLSPPKSHNRLPNGSDQIKFKFYLVFTEVTNYSGFRHYKLTLGDTPSDIELLRAVW